MLNNQFKKKKLIEGLFGNNEVTCYSLVLLLQCYNTVFFVVQQNLPLRFIVKKSIIFKSQLTINSLIK